MLFRLYYLAGFVLGPELKVFVEFFTGFVLVVAVEQGLLTGPTLPFVPDVLPIIVCLFEVIKFLILQKY